MNQYFNLNRIINLCKRQILFNRQMLSVGFGTITAFMLIITILCAYFNTKCLSQLINWNLTIIFVSGFLFTSIIFNELRNKSKAIFYLTLPVSNVERLFVAWFLTSPVLVIVLSFILYFINVLGIIISTGSFITVQPFFSLEYFHTLLNYLLIQPIFLLGSVMFKKNNFLKTVLSIILIFMFLIMYAMINARFILGAIGTNIIHINFDQNSFSGINSLYTYSWILLSPFFFIVSYFKLKEKEL